MPKQPDQPTQIPPQEQPKAGEERTKDLEDKLTKGAEGALGQGLSMAWDQFSTSWLGKRVSDKVDQDPAVNFFSNKPLG